MVLMVDLLKKSYQMHSSEYQKLKFSSFIRKQSIPRQFPMLSSAIQEKVGCLSNTSHFTPISSSHSLSSVCSKLSPCCNLPPGKSQVSFFSCRSKILFSLMINPFIET